MTAAVSPVPWDGHDRPAADPGRLDLTQMDAVERGRFEALMRDPAWEGTARIDRYWPAIWWNVGGAVALLVIGVAAWLLGGVIPLAIACAVYPLVQMFAARRCAPKPPGRGLSALAVWPLCTPQDGAGPWLALLGLGVAAWVVGTLHTRGRQPRRRRPVRPTSHRAGVAR